VPTSLTKAHDAAVTRARIEFDSPEKMIACLDALCTDSAEGIILVMRVKSLGLSTPFLNGTTESHATAGFRVIEHHFFPCCRIPLDVFVKLSSCWLKPVLISPPSTLRRPWLSA
jgi:hypothetical protein